MTLSGRFVHRAWGYAQRRGVVTAGTPAGRRFAAFGTGSMLAFPPGTVPVEIGADVFTGPYVYLTDQNHGYANPDTPIGGQFPVNSPVNSPVSIGAGCWLGAGAIVLPGAAIGRNVVVAAGSVVRGVVPDHRVVAGVPARVVRSYVPGVGWLARSGHVVKDVAELANSAD